eukprot:Nk52_evm6s163 gene=Nk52_evmTU6s163
MDTSLDGDIDFLNSSTGTIPHNAGTSSPSAGIMLDAARAAAATLHPFVKEQQDKITKAQNAERREIGQNAAWSLSTWKQGFGVEQLRDACVDTYWQSDGPQPHLVNIHFNKRTTIKEICIYTDFKQDESYTPSKLAIRVGANFHDLQEIEVCELEQPQGWLSVVLKRNQTNGQFIRCNLLQIAILANHQNGRDTHLRQIKIYGPRQPSVPDCPEFANVEYSQFACIR